MRVVPKRIFTSPKDSDFVEQKGSSNMIFERIQAIERGRLLKSDAKMYGTCALLAQEHLKNGDLKEAAEKALVIRRFKCILLIA